MFDILLPEQSEQPLYQQLYFLIRDSIRSGGIANGQRLPSVRSLQHQLNISKTPIETAYQMLTAEGYVISKPRSGLYAVNPDQRGAARAMSSAEADKTTPADSVQGTGYSLPPVQVDFNPTALDPGAFPVRVWNKMLKDSLDHQLHEIGHYGDPLGEYGLRMVVSDYLRNSRGVQSTPEQVVIGAGTAYSIGVLSKMLKDIRAVGFEEPGYSLVRDQFQLNGFQVLPIPVQDTGISIAALKRRQVQLVYVTPSHQFPTGGIMPYPERERLLQWAEDNHAYIIEDDYDGEFRYHGKPIPSLQGLDRSGRVIYAGTFSKVLTPTLRMNYLVLPPELMIRLKKMRQELFFAPSRVEQWAMESFFKEGHWYRHIRRARSLYRKRHRHLIDILHAYLGEHVEISGQNSGLHIQLTVKKPVTSDELIRLAAEQGVRVYDLRKMWIGQTQDTGQYPRLYMGFAGLREEEMDYGIQLLRKAWSLES